MYLKTTTHICYVINNVNEFLELTHSLKCCVDEDIHIIPTCQLYKLSGNHCSQCYQFVCNCKCSKLISF